MKYSFIIIGSKKIKIKQLANKEKGIKFLFNDELADYFYLTFNSSIHMEKLVIGSNKKTVTLMDCFYTVRNTSKGVFYVHLIYNEFIDCIVESRNFTANKIKIILSKNNIRNTLFENVSFKYSDFIIKYDIRKENINIIISSNQKVKRNDLFDMFATNYELLNIMLGFFPTIIKTIYYNGKSKMILKQKYVDKYYTNDEYIKNDLCFFDKIDTNLVERCFKDYKEFSNSNRIHIDVYFMSLMKKSSYIDVRMVNILHSLDGMYDKLKFYSEQLKEYPEEMNNEIIQKFKEIDLVDIKNKYKSNTDINSKIDNLFQRAYLYGFRNKLKKMLSFDEYILFNQEKNNKRPLNINSLLEKMVNTRNKLSHADENEKLQYLTSTECLSYFLKLILLYRLLIMNEINLYEKINKIYLYNHLNSVDRYISRLLKEDISDVIFKHVGMRKFDITNFEIVKNNSIENCKYKPCNGGYWASPENSKNSWENTQQLDDISKIHIVRFKITSDARIKYIFENKDLYYLPHIDDDIKKIDFEKASDIYDVIYYCPKDDEILTLLPSWDCEYILVLNPHVMDIIENK